MTTTHGAKRRARRPFLASAATWSTLIAGMLAASSARADTLGDLEAPFRAALESGHWLPALGLVFAAGLATSLTPCVYPMIAITVSIFGARQARSRFEAMGLSSLFVLGMAALFTPLGLLAATSGGLFGGALSSPIVLIGLALLFLVFAASMFGAFELDLPHGLKNRLATVGGMGPRGAFLLGLVSALIAAPCTGPVLGFLLTWVGATGALWFGALSLFVYALGLGLLFWVVGTFSVALPKSGRWLEWVKSAFGIVMVTMAVYYVRHLMPGFTTIVERTPPFLLGAGLLLVAGLVLGAVHASFHGSSRTTRVRKAAGIAACVAGLMGLVGYVQAPPQGAQIAWLDDYDAAKALAADEGKPLLVDFSASWCGACGELDLHTFSDPQVASAARAFVPVRVDMSPGSDTPRKRAVLAGYGHRGLPLVVIHGPDGRELARVTQFIEPDEMLDLLERAR